MDIVDSIAVEIGPGKSVQVRAITLADLPALTRSMRKSVGRVDWSTLDDLSVSDAALALLDLCPEVFAEVLALMSGATPAAVLAWKPVVVVRVLDAVLEVNEADALKEILPRFFGRIKALLPATLTAKLNAAPEAATPTPANA